MFCMVKEQYCREKLEKWQFRRTAHRLTFLGPRKKSRKSHPAPIDPDEHEPTACSNLTVLRSDISENFKQLPPPLPSFLITMSPTLSSQAQHLSESYSHNTRHHNKVNFTSYPHIVPKRCPFVFCLSPIAGLKCTCDIHCGLVPITGHPTFPLNNHVCTVWGSSVMFHSAHDYIDVRT